MTSGRLRFGRGVPCARCSDGWTAHEETEPPGTRAALRVRGRCLARDADGRCPCPGYLWVGSSPLPPGRVW